LIWRISDRRAFQRLARDGRRARTGTLWCSFVNDPAASPVRVAFAVGRSVGPATVRNRLRRRLRAIVANAAPSAGVAAGWLLLGATPAARALTFADLQAEVDTLLARVSPNAMSRR
jgi:ribonuclease P protein component